MNDKIFVRHAKAAFASSLMGCTRPAFCGVDSRTLSPAVSPRFSVASSFLSSSTSASFAKQRRRPKIIHMSIVEDVSKRLTSAMKAKDVDATRALRLIRAGFLTKMKEDGSSSLDDSDAVAVLRKLAKMRRESIDMFRQGGRDDLATTEQHDLTIIESYLPKLADEQTTTDWARQAIQDSGATGPAQAGKAIGALMKKHRGEVDGALAKSIITKLLSQ